MPVRPMAEVLKGNGIARLNASPTSRSGGARAGFG